MTPWVDMSLIAVLPTLDEETLAARKERARQRQYAELRERRRQAQRMLIHHASETRQAHHHVPGGRV
jgi:hypothetical protein